MDTLTHALSGALLARAAAPGGLPARSIPRWVAAFDGMTEGSTCVWSRDLRFLTPGRDVVPFRFAACRTAPGEPWRLSGSR